MEKKVKIYIFSGIVTLLVIFSVTFQLFHAESFESRLARAMGMINQLQSSVLQTNISSSNIDFLESVYQDSLKRVESIKKFREEDKKKLIQRVQETGQAGNGPNGLTQIGEDIISLSTQKVDDFDTNIDTRIGNIGTLTEDQKTQIKKLAKSINTLTNDIRLTSQFINWYEEMRPTICQTTDPTNNPTLKGVLTFKFNTALPSLTDTCSADGASVVQYRCLGMQYRDDEAHKQTLACPGGCSDGVCTQKISNQNTSQQACYAVDMVGQFVFSKGTKIYNIPGNSNNGSLVVVTDSVNKNYRKTIAITTTQGTNANMMNDKIYISTHTYENSSSRVSNGSTGTGKNIVTVIDTNLDKIIQTINLKDDKEVVSYMKGYIVGTKIYITSSSTSNTALDKEISVIDTKTDTVIKTISVGKNPDFLGLKGNKLYSIDQTSGLVSMINTESDTIEKTISTKNGSYVFKQLGDKFYILSSQGNTNGTLTILDGNSDTVIATIAVGKIPSYIIFSNTKAYIGNKGISGADSSISVIDLSTNAILKTITGFISPESGAIVGNKLYIVDNGNNKEGIYVIDGSNDTIIKNIPLKYITNIIPADNYIYVAIRDTVNSLFTGLGSVVVIDSTTDTTIATMPTEQPGNITSIIDNKLYISPNIVIDTSIKNPSNTCENPQKPLLVDITAQGGISSAEIRWGSDRSTNAVVRYGKTTAYESNASSDTFTKDHILTLSNLTPLSTYHFQITGTDRSGNIVTSTDKTFTTGNPAFINGILDNITDAVAVGTKIYLSSNANRKYDIVNTVDNSVQHKSLSGSVVGLKFSITGNQVLAGASGETPVFIDTGNGTVMNAINFIGTPKTSSKLGNKSYINNTTEGTISVVDTVTNKAITTINLPAGPRASTVIGDKLYAILKNGIIVIIDTNHDTILGSETNTVPVISNIESNVTDKSIMLTWKTDQKTKTEILFDYKAGELGSQGYTPMTTNIVINEDDGLSHTAILNELQYDTLHRIIIRSINNFGILAKSPVQEITTSDITAPEIRSIIVKNRTIGKNSVTISWLTNKSANSIIEYGTESSYGQTKKDETMVKKEFDRSLGTNVFRHSITLSELTAGTTYHFSVESANASGAITKNPDKTFTTLGICSIENSGAVFSSPYGDNLYILNQYDQSITVFDTKNNKTVTKIQVEGKPYQTIPSTDGYIYILAQTNNDYGVSMIVINPLTNKVEKTIVVSGTGSAIFANKFAFIGTNLYKLGSYLYQLNEISKQLFDPIYSVPLLGPTTMEKTDKKLYIGTTEGEILIVDTNTKTIIKTLHTVGGNPNPTSATNKGFIIASKNVGKYMYFIGQVGTSFEYQITVVDNTNDTIIQTIPIKNDTVLLGISDKDSLYTMDLFGRIISVISPVDGKIKQTITLPNPARIPIHNGNVIDGEVLFLQTEWVEKIGENLYIPTDKNIFVFNETTKTFKELENTGYQIILGTLNNNIYLGRQNEITILDTTKNTLINTCENPPVGN